MIGGMLLAIISGGNKFPLSLVPVKSAADWTLTDLSADGSFNGVAFGAAITSNGYISLNSSNKNTAGATRNKAIDLTTAKELVIKYSQNYSMVPRVSLVNVSTGKTDYILTPTAYGMITDIQTAKLDISAAKGRYYISIDTVNYYGDRDCIVKALDIN